MSLRVDYRLGHTVQVQLLCKLVFICMKVPSPPMGSYAIKGIPIIIWDLG